MVRRPVRSVWRRQRIPIGLLGLILRPRGMGGVHSSSRATLAPQVRGHVQPRVVDALERRGWHVHRIGAAAYVHADTTHLIFGVWPRRTIAPGWATRLGRASAAYVRRLERLTRAQRWRRQARDGGGHFGAVRPWTHWPTPALYSWDPAGPSVAEQIDRQEAVNRWRAGLLGDVVELELRGLDGDR